MTAHHPHQATTLYATQQQGSVLLISLVFLLLLAWLGMGAAHVAQQEMVMSTSTQDTQRAFEAAENALQEVQAQLATWQHNFNGPGLLDHSQTAAAWPRVHASSAGYWLSPQTSGGYGWFDESGQMNNNVSVAAQNTTDHLGNPAHYVVEYLGLLSTESRCGQPPQHHYRATAWATGQLVSERPLSAPHVLLQAEWCLCVEVACGAENTATEQHAITQQIFWQQLH